MPIDLPMRFEDAPLLLSVPDVYSPRDCQLRHEGCPVRSGTKYAMRADVLYEADDAIRTPGMGVDP
jgi:hypothetical protein